jgi:hypothetical protein
MLGCEHMVFGGAFVMLGGVVGNGGHRLQPISIGRYRTLKSKSSALALPLAIAEKRVPPWVVWSTRAEYQVATHDFVAAAATRF